MWNTNNGTFFTIIKKLVVKFIKFLL